MTKNELKYYSNLKQKKFRDLENKYLIEGTHLVEECLTSKYYSNNLERIFINKLFSFPEKLSAHLSKMKVNIEIIDEQSFKKLSETESPQGIIGIVRKNPISTILHTNKNEKFYVFLENINDPGNLGTILRNAYWFGIENICISKNSTDVFNSKTIRSSQGAIFNLKIIFDLDNVKTVEYFRENNFEIILSDLNTENILSSFKINSTKQYLLVFGNEANGISNELLMSKENTRLKIDGFSKCESLNVASASAIFFYHFKTS